MKTVTTLTIALIFIMTPGMVSGQILYNEPIALDAPSSLEEPDTLDLSKSGYVEIVVYLDEGSIKPLEGVTVVLFTTDYDFIDTNVTDEVGETNFIAPAGVYIVHVEHDRDYLEREIVLPAGGAAETQVFVFSYNPDSSGRMMAGETEPVCPGIVKIEVMEAALGMVMLVPDAEVQLASTGGDIARTGYTNKYGLVTFVVEEGFYKIICTHDGEEQSRWVFIPCGETVEGIKFFF